MKSLKKNNDMKLLYSSILTLLLVISQPTIAFDKAFDRWASTQINKTIELDGVDKVKLENPFGQIIITTSEEQELSIEALVKVNGKKQDQVDEMLDRISIEDDRFSGTLTIQSILNEETSMWKSFLRKIGNEVSGAKITVDFAITMPNDLDLEITSKYGEVVLPDWTGDVQLDISHAELNAKSLSNLNMSLKASDFHIMSIGSGDLTIKNCDGEIEGIEEARINSGSSDIEIQSASKLYLDTKNDRYRLKSVGALSGKTLFAKIKVEELVKSADLKMNFGYLHLNRVATDFTLIDCNSKMTDYEINLEKNHSVSFDIKASEKGFVIDDKYWGADWEWVNEKEKFIHLTGSKEASPKSRILINAERGDVRIALTKDAENL